MVKNSPCNPEGLGSIPGQETKTPHAAEQLSLQVMTTDPVCFGVRAPRPESPCTARQDPHDVTKILHAATKTSCSQINKKKRKEKLGVVSIRE